MSRPKGDKDPTIIAGSKSGGDWLAGTSPAEPRSTIYHFKPLTERVEVFIRPFD